MKITFLDASTLDRGDIDFTPLEEVGDITLHAITHGSEAVQRSDGANIVISNKVPVTSDLIKATPTLKLVVSSATGINQIDLEACRKAGIGVANVAGYSTVSVAQHTFALILEFATRVGTIHQSVRSDWPASPIFTRLDYPLFDLSQKTLGIVGLGAIGKAVARIGNAFGMHVVALARNGSAPSESIPRLDSTEFFAVCDIVSLHCPLTDENHHLIDATVLAAMKPGAILINTSRGSLIDEAALAKALRSKQIGGAGLDVLSTEPPRPDHVLLAPDLPNLILTPHTAWSTRESRLRLLDGIVANIRSFQSGGTLNRIV